jgi:hypothetical protein
MRLCAQGVREPTDSQTLPTAHDELPPCGFVSLPDQERDMMAEPANALMSLPDSRYRVTPPGFMAIAGCMT